jgi:starch-binding outer membrane protein, SusD/RagB family
MNKNRFIQTALIATLVLGTISCKDQLDVGNPNSPSALPKSEAAVLELATGGVYINGFLNGTGWLGNSYFSLPMGYNELLADNVGASASNNQVTTIAQPDYIILDDGTKRTNPSPTVGIVRTYNTRASTGAGNNAIHYQWLTMYSMNNAMNNVLSIVDGIPIAVDAPSKVATIKAWCYFWKGFAYASIGTKYYAGLIVNTYGEPSSTYVSHDAMIAESNKYFDLAATTLDGVTATGAYEAIMGDLIPTQNQVGNGGVPSIAEFKKNINTLKARNLIFNKIAKFVNGSTAGTITGTSMSGSMTTADWNTVKTLTGAGIQQGDIVFTGRTTGTNDFFSASGGTVSALTANPASTSTFKPSERALQHFKAGDKRFTNNFTAASPYSNDYIYGVRYTLSNGGKGDPDAIVYANRNIGEHELIIAGSYEENALMLAEANIRTGAIDEGLALIDDVRDYMGAGLAPVTGTGLTEAQALTELVRERRVALMYRGLTFHDNRRWGITYDIAKGGGAFGTTIVLGSQVNTNATINYNFMDYWDVPANESVLNPPDGSSVAVVNPNF